MGREYLIVWAGRHQRSHWEEICASYRSRIVRLAPLRDLPVRARTSPEDPQRQRAEGEALLAALPDPVWTIALDSRGEKLSSEQFAERLARLKDEWPHPVAFLIGSDLGHDKAVLDAARQVLSFGSMTLTHELARVVLYEQIFRALSIEAGMSYHRAPV